MQAGTTHFQLGGLVAWQYSQQINGWISTIICHWWDSIPWSPAYKPRVHASDATHTYIHTYIHTYMHAYIQSCGYHVIIIG